MPKSGLAVKQGLDNIQLRSLPAKALNQKDVTESKRANHRSLCSSAGVARPVAHSTRRCMLPLLICHVCLSFYRKSGFVASRRAHRCRYVNFLQRAVIPSFPPPLGITLGINALLRNVPQNHSVVAAACPIAHQIASRAGILQESHENYEWHESLTIRLFCESRRIRGEKCRFDYWNARGKVSRAYGPGRRWGRRWAGSRRRGRGAASGRYPSAC